MSEQPDKQAPLRLTYTGIGSALGLVLGGVFGMIVENMIIFSGGGLVLGGAIGAAIDLRNQAES